MMLEKFSNTRTVSWKEKCPEIISEVCTDEKKIYLELDTGSSCLSAKQSLVRFRNIVMNFLFLCLIFSILFYQNTIKFISYICLKKVLSTLKTVFYYVLGLNFFFWNTSPIT